MSWKILCRQFDLPPGSNSHVIVFQASYRSGGSLKGWQARTAAMARAADGAICGVIPAPTSSGGFKSIPSFLRCHRSVTRTNGAFAGDLQCRARHDAMTVRISDRSGELGPAGFGAPWAWAGPVRQVAQKSSKVAATFNCTAPPLTPPGAPRLRCPPGRGRKSGASRSSPRCRSRNRGRPSPPAAV